MAFLETTTINLKPVWIDFLRASKSAFKYEKKVFSSIWGNIPYKLKKFFLSVQKYF